MKKYAPVLALVGALVLPGCTLTNETGEKVNLVSVEAIPVILAEMRKGCPALIAVGDATKAVAVAIKAAENVQGTINNVSNMASIGCSLLVASTKPAG